MIIRKKNYDCKNILILFCQMMTMFQTVASLLLVDYLHIRRTTHGYPLCDIQVDGMSRSLRAGLKLYNCIMSHLLSYQIVSTIKVISFSAKFIDTVDF